MKTLKLNIQIILLAIIGLSISSCEQDATGVDIPAIESKLVVQCFISPQNPETKAFVSFSRPIFGNARREDWITDATVEITDGTTFKRLVLDNNSGRNPVYIVDSNDFKIVEGVTYTLYVSTPDGRTVNAKCTVPQKIDGASLTYTWDTIVKTDLNVGSIERRVRANMSWRDNQSGKTYYRAGASALVVTTLDTSSTFTEIMVNNNTSDLFTNEGNEGSTFTRNSLEREIVEQIGGSVGQFSFRPKGIEFYVLTCDENYYRYHKTGENNVGDDPFSEPVLVYSNIIGGLGCFGATNQYLERVNFW